MNAAFAALISGCMALAGAWMTHHFSQRRQRRERLWDLKREAYAELIEAFRENIHLQGRIERIDFENDAAAMKEIAAMADTVNDERKKMRRAKSRNIFLLDADGRAIVLQHDARLVELEEMINRDNPDWEGYNAELRPLLKATLNSLIASATRRA